MQAAFVDANGTQTSNNFTCLLMTAIANGLHEISSVATWDLTVQHAENLQELAGAVTVDTITVATRHRQKAQHIIVWLLQPSLWTITLSWKVCQIKCLPTAAPKLLWTLTEMHGTA